MKVTVQVIIESETQESPVIEEIACLRRGELSPETLGLTLSEAKDLLGCLQTTMVTHQAAEYVEEKRVCPDCGHVRPRKGRHEIVFRSLFGTLTVPSPRLYICSCQEQSRQSDSPLAERLPERTAPELLYLQTRWASLMSYGLTVDLLEEVLPIHLNVAAVFRNLHQTAERMESELGDEQSIFVEGCQRDWERLPEPDPPLTVGIDGGYVHGRDGENRKAGWFEVIAGKSMPEDDPSKSFGFVNGYDQKPRRRLFELLRSQGLQMNQDITFLSDGGDTVRDLQLYLSPQAEHLLDWFHITMRVTVMKQMAKGIPQTDLVDPEAEIDRVKWYLWHGNVFRALQVTDDLYFDLDGLDDACQAVIKLRTTVDEFRGYIANNSAFIPNYGDRYRYGEVISTAFVESTINQVVSKRMVKKQQMRWTKRGAHLLLQVRTQVLNDEWRDTFCRWYPGMLPAEVSMENAA